MPRGNQVEFFMKEALKQAKKAYAIGEIPVGAVIVYQNKIIARAYNQREKKQDASAHAELLAIQKACKVLQSWRLENCSLYVTLEPCAMCAGAIIQARIENVFYGAKNARFGAHKGAVQLFAIPFNHQVHVQAGILEEECSLLVSNFFNELRKSK